MTTASTTIKLTPAQQQLIAAAAANPGRALVPPAGRNGKPLGKTAAKLAEALFGQGLVREVRTKSDLPLWREDETGKRYSLVLTKAGHAAAAQQAQAPETAQQLDADRDADANGADAAAASPRSGSKLAGVIDLLQRPEGAPVSALMAATGWLPHTTRAALTGLRKRGYAVLREAADGGSVYRIQDAPTGDATAAAA